MAGAEGEWRSGDIPTVAIDPAVFAANQLLGQLIDARISPQVSNALTRLRAKLEGERDHEWIEMRTRGVDDFSVSYQMGNGGERILWVGNRFSELLGGAAIDQATAITFIGDLIYHGCMCADGNHDWAEKRQQEFLERPEAVLNMLNLNP